MRILFRSAVFLVAACVLFPLLAGVDEFPQKTEDGWTLASGAQRLRFGMAFWEEDNGPRIQEYVGSWARGFDGGIELGIAFPYVASDPETADSDSGFSDFLLHAEFDIGRHLFFEWENPADALSVNLTYFPKFGKSARRLEIHDKAFETALVASRDMEWAVGHANLGILWYEDTFERDGENVESSLFFRLGATRRFTKGSELFGEFLWQDAPDKNEKTDIIQVGFGTRFPLRGNLSLDGGIWLGLTDTAPEAQLALGTSYSF